MIKKNSLTMAVIAAAVTMTAGDSSAAKDAKNYINSNNELMIYGDVGDWWEGNDALSIVAQLEHLNTQGEIKVRIHSDGGNYLEGLAIYNALKQSKHKVIVQIDGFAGSMATIVALAGDEIHMPRNAYQFIHFAGAHASGNHNDLRATADQLEEFSKQAASIYAERSNLTEEEWLELMSANTWMNAETCLERGLIDKILDPVEVVAHAIHLDDEIMAPAGFAALMSLPKAGEDLTPDSAPADDPENSEEEDDVPDPNKAHMNAGGGKKPGENGGNQPAATAPTEAEMRAEAAKAEKARQKELRQIASMSNKRGEYVTAEMLNEWLDGDTTPDQARDAALKAISAADKENMPNGRSSGSSASGADMAADITAAIAHRCNPRENKIEGTNEFAHMSLIDVSRAYLSASGVPTAGMNSRQIAAAAMQSTSDLPNIFADVAQNELARGYASRQRTFTQFARQRNLKNFKPANITRMSDAPQLLPKTENGEYKLGHLQDSQQSIALETKGRIIKISREMIINDDLDALSRLPQMMGAQAALNEIRVVYALLSGNPTLGDGVKLFHADHKNLATGAALSVDSIGELRKLLRLQKSFAAKGETGYALNTPLAGLIVPAAMETEAEKLVASVVAAKSGDVNPFTSLKVIAEAELDAGGVSSGFFGFGDPNLVDTIEYGYLEGEEGAFIDSEMEFTTDAMVLKVRHDFAAQVADHRGLVKNPGA